MKIAVDIRALGDEQLTGVGRYVYQMLSSLHQTRSQENDELIVWFSGGGHVRERIRTRIAPFSFPIVEIKVPNKVLSAASLLLQKSLHLSLAPTDFHWIPNINFLPRSLPPYALTVHDVSFLHAPYFYSMKRRLWHRLIKAKSIIQNASLILAVSQSTRHDIMRFFPQIPNDHIVIVPPGMENSSSLLTDNDLSLPDRYILYVGTIEPRKNIDSIFKAFELISQSDTTLHLVLAGAKGWSTKHMVKLFSKNPKIHWLHYVSDQQKNFLYANALAFVWPSFYEGFGFPPVEALTHGLPVITSYRTSLPEILGPYALYVNPYNPAELATVIRSCIENKIRGGVPASVISYSWNAAAAKLKEAIHFSYENRH